MRALAEFIMRGRTQAAIVAIVGHWVPLLTPAAIGLVTLRRGPADGLWVLMWGLLPAIVLLAMSQPSALLAINGAVSLYLSAVLLRTSASWRHTLMGLVAVNTLGALILALLFPELLGVLVQLCVEVFEHLQAQSQQSLGLPVPDATLVLGLLAAMTAASGIVGLIVARWWQALLYNPGGFAGEFRALRLGPVEALVCAAAVGYCYAQPVNYAMWQIVFMLPLLFAGIALVHDIAARRGVGTPWLVVFYVVFALLLQPFITLLVAVAFVDTWLNIRGRVSARS
ncbi:MAG TPA: hypothetical protein VIC08_13950 [Cellvibrionaceae bacterium]